MSRVKRGTKARQRRKNVLKLAKGFRDREITVSRQPYTLFVGHFVTRIVTEGLKSASSVSYGSSASMPQRGQLALNTQSLCVV